MVSCVLLHKQNSGKVRMNKSKARIFLVDDHPLVREWLTNLIHQQPDLSVCGEAETAPQALQAMAELKPDVAIVDISLKSGSGIELIKNIKATPTPGRGHRAFHARREPLRGTRSARRRSRLHHETRDGQKSHRRHPSGIGRQNVPQRAACGVVRGKICGRDSPALTPPVDQLSDRELEVFQLLGQGYETRQIAENLNISIKTVQAYCARIKEKLKLGSATELLREAIRWHESQQIN